MDSPQKAYHGNVQAVLDQLGFGWYQVKVIIILGVAQAADTMETFIQAILGPTIRCEWNLDTDYVALLATMVFLGVCIGSPMMGYFSDHLGRKSLNILCCISLTYMTCLCAIVPNYVWLATLRFIAGFYISGLLAAANTMISEFLPEIYQATGQLLVCSFDSVVALYITGVGFGCHVARLSWRYFLLFTTLPLLGCAGGLSCMIHESPVILAQWGKQNEAARILDCVAKTNKRIPRQSFTESGNQNDTFSFVGRLSENEGEAWKVEFSVKGFMKVVKILTVDYSPATFLLMWINTIWGMIMYGGTTLLPVEIPSTSRTCLQSLTQGPLEPLYDPQSIDSGNADCCVPLHKEGYLSLLSSAIGSFMSFPIALGLITLIGRKWTINVCFFLTSILLFIEAFCLPSNVMRALFFATRAIASAGSNATAIYLTGLYTPRIRSLAFGVMSTFYRIGVLLAPYLGQIFLQRVSVLGAILIFSGLSMLGFISTIVLPHSESQRSKTTGQARRIFRNIFKTRAPVTAEEASAAAGSLQDNVLICSGRTRPNINALSSIPAQDTATAKPVI